MYFQVLSKAKSKSISKRMQSLHPIYAHVGTGGLICFAFYSSNRGAWVDVWFYTRDWEIERIQMATKYGVEFVRLKLTRDQEPAFKAWAGEHQVDMFDYLLQLVEDGYKVSINLDPNNDCFIVAFSGTAGNRTNKGLCMVSRSDDVLEAIAIGLYKHIVVCDAGNWGEPEDAQKDWG